MYQDREHVALVCPFVVVNYASLKRDKFTGLTYIYVTIYHCMHCYCARYYSILHWYAHLCIDCTSYYNTALYTADIADVTILCDSYIVVSYIYTVSNTWGTVLALFTLTPAILRMPPLVPSIMHLL